MEFGIVMFPAGVSRCLFTVPSAGPDEVLTLLDRYADLVAHVG